MKTKRSLLSLFLSLAIFFGVSSVPAYAGYLYVINDAVAGNTIYGFSVNEETGTLTLLSGFPLSTGFIGAGSTNLEMITIDKVNNRLYAVNRGSNNISAYSINTSTGALSALPFSPIAGPVAPRTIEVHPSGSPLIVGGDSLASYVITAKSATPAAGSPYTFATGINPAGSTLSRGGGYYYTGGNAGNFFGGYVVDAGTGVLTPLAGSPFEAGTSSPNPTETDLSGRLFVINSRNGLARIYTTEAGVPTPVTGSPFATGMTSFAATGAVHPNKRFFMLGDRTNNRVGVYTLAGSGADTTFTAIAGSPFLTGGTTSSTLIFNQTGAYLFVANAGNRSITTFRANGLTGVLSDRVVSDPNTAGAAGTLNGIAYVNYPSVGENVGIAGRVSSAAGNPVSRATVTITNGQNTRTALTNPFGYYLFDAVAGGDTYTITVSSKAGTFTQRSLTVTTERTDIDFIAQ